MTDSAVAAAGRVGSADAVWREVMADRPHAPLRELVAGLDTVAALPIPYTRLPRRAYNAYSADFTCWADIATQTPDSLLSRRNAGEGTVCALLAAATHAVAANAAAAAAAPVGAVRAVRRLLGELDERDRMMLAARVWAPRPQPQRILAERLGVNPAWVWRNQPWFEARLVQLLGDPGHHEVAECAAQLRRRLGPYVPRKAVAAQLDRLGVDSDSETALVLLHLGWPLRAP